MFSNSFLSGRNDLAGIQYLGSSGISQSCFCAVKRLLQFGDRIEHVKILTAEHNHCLLLAVDSEGWMAVKSGFSSGYRGEGPTTFAEILNLLKAFGVEIEECDVPTDLIERLDTSALTVGDLERIQTAKNIRPRRWHEYIYDAGLHKVDPNAVLRAFPHVMPWSIIDTRIADLALRFFDTPDDSILTGFRRLEDIVRKRLPPDAPNTRLFAQAFQSEKSTLVWKDVESGEQTGRGQLFTGAYMAYRNPRAHRELQGDPNELLAEFLLLNHLYMLEKAAVLRSPEDPSC
ncbi:TIGR02391 family protein [Rhodoferax sp.]|uniref:TIGR02391 family protein n=2 Tax=Rhodoferax sp. TaxID=50421 RepID=UPI00273158D8|nr:TIGR02391 family protein [Rhodoferax sp.]MDP1530339.1 TIGR02391 family protein [Rhodoferax sp.]MDP1943315.1 TIGR02391 family protein [Rhodoferax sp.]MDP2442641.1 TIGR02391 family protein [Rhodoferax sp.]MDP3865003.1 TIGR02391 family protein [Rhodoferax sp.]MDZ4209054.1 TIGR02391 family protein [Rhodoferax sp.]